MNEKFKDEDNPNVLYAISMSWFKDWENFVRGKMDSEYNTIIVFTLLEMIMIIFTQIYYCEAKENYIYPCDKTMNEY